MRRCNIAVACMLGACTSQGTFDLVLTLPTAPELRPAGMTTVTVVLTSGEDSPVATTSVLDENNSFSAGDLGIAQDVRIEVQLRDVSNRLVGLGEAADLVDIAAGEATTVSIPVRRPFVYASSGTALFSFDPTLDPTDSKFQGQLTGVTAPQVVVSVGGDRLAIISTSQLSVLATDTNRLVGTPIALPGVTRDAAAVPGTRQVAIAHDKGIAIVDIDTGQVTNAAVGPVDRVTVGPAPDGRLLAYGLVGRVEPKVNPLQTCDGTSSIVTIDVAAPAAVTPKPLPQAVSDLAASPESTELFATLPCMSKVVKVQGDIEGPNLTFMDFAPLERAAVLAVAGGRVWAAGTHASLPSCSDQLGNEVPCQPSSPTSCPPTGPSNNSVVYVTEGAHLIVQSIPLAGGTAITLDLPGRRETVFDEDDPAKQHAQVLRAFGTVPLDLVALPGGQYVGLVTTSNYYIEQLSQGTNIILPCLDATTSDWLLLDLASSSIAQRVRTSCELTVGPANDFPNWKCDAPPPGELSLFDYVPVSVGALFGAR
ncbi:MAG: hypothetical protein H6Q90_5072 [Deltaproteobacteria bacterium]|nr:hypothetical protein [Deltaproteobacteria bacterium]